MLRTERLTALQMERAHTPAHGSGSAPKAISTKFIFLLLLAALLVNATTVLMVLPKVSSIWPLTAPVRHGVLFLFRTFRGDPAAISARSDKVGLGPKATVAFSFAQK